MLTPRPDKYRGARLYASLAANPATFAGVLYLPPASGAIVRFVSSEQSLRIQIAPPDQTPAFTSGLAVTTLTNRPTWGPDYAITGAWAGGQFAATLPEGFPASNSSAAGAMSHASWELYPPNALAIANGIVNQATFLALEVYEYPSAEELNRWQSQRA